jgi:beta-galactosidase GanA
MKYAFLLRLYALLELFCYCLFLQSASAQSKPADAYIGKKQLYYGAAYYPEAWPITEVDKDIQRMKELNMNVMRIGEFAWSTMEPEEGKYNFKWLHEVVDKLAKNGIDVILGTPTATPPAWMLEKYPDMLRTNPDGSVRYHGGRRDCSYSSETYRRKSIEICEKMAQEFGNKTNVIGWQTDNEFGFTPDYSKETEAKWHKWLMAKYHTIDNLNRIWNTALWSQTYNKFEQVPMPRNFRKGEKNDVWHHPSLSFAWNRFTNEQIAEFQKLQEQAIRKYTKQPITHDAMPGQLTDYEIVMSSVDFPAMNSYSNYQVYNQVVPNWDRQRGFKKGMHWLFETTPNFSGGDRTWFNHEIPGSTRTFIWINHALGAQGSMFWLWRQQSAGQEMTHGSVISAWGKPIANYELLKKLGAELKSQSEFLMDNPVVQAEAAIVYSHAAMGGLDIEPYVGDLKYNKDWHNRFYLPIMHAGIHRDVIYPSADLSSYKIVFAPMLPYLPDDFKQRIKTWVENGGTLVLGPMSAYRTPDWTAHTQAALGDLEQWMGIAVDERVPISSIPMDPLIPTEIKWNSIFDVKTSIAGLWTESLSSKSGRILATYGQGWLPDKAAAIENKVGKGRVVLLGTDPGEEAFGKLAVYYARQAGVNPLLPEIDKNVLVVPRKGKDQALFVINLDKEPKKIQLPVGSWTDRLSNQTFGNNTLSLKPFDVLLLQKQKN